MRCRPILTAAAISLLGITGQQVAAAEPSNADSGLVAKLLDRPLFSVTRRPRVAAIVSQPAVSSLPPRLTGIVVYDGHGEALFAAPDQPRAVTAHEGGRVGVYIVRRIEPQQVTVSGPEGSRTLRTSFDATPPAARAATASPKLPSLPLTVPAPQRGMAP